MFVSKFDGLQSTSAGSRAVAMTMPTRLEHLRRSLAQGEAEGHNGPLVQGLRAQIMGLERDLERRLTGGFFDKSGKITYKHQNPMD